MRKRITVAALTFQVDVENAGAGVLVVDEVR